MYDVIIIGSGPAGLSAAIYAGRAKFDTLIIEEKPMSGGQIVNTSEVDNYPGLPGVGGFELAQKMREHAQKSGVTFAKEQAVSVEDKQEKKLVTTNQKQYEAKAVIIASGDGAFFRNRTVAVAGGGDVALEDALFLARGCEKVYLIHRRDSFRGAKVLAEQVQTNEKIEILYDTVVEEICGEGMVEKIKILNKKTQEEKMLPVNGIFIAVGMVPNNVKVIPDLALDDTGYIKAGEDGRSSVPGIYAVGDVRTKQLRQVVTAVADGANAIASMESDGAIS